MDISFMASAGEEGNWSLDECARWAHENDFDCVRLADRGALDSQTIIDGGASSVRDTLSQHDIYLSCITAHHNLLDDDGSLATTQKNMTDQVDDITEQIAAHERRVKSNREALIRNFVAMEEAQAKVNQQMSFLASRFGGGK